MIENIFNFFQRKIVDLEADLYGVNGFTGRGEIEFSLRKNGVKKLEVELRGIAGRSAELVVAGCEKLQIPLSNGSIEYRLSSSAGDNVPQLNDGDPVEIWQNGEAILSGILHTD